MISGTFFTLDEVAKLVSRDRRTMTRWLTDGKMHGQRIGNVVFVSAEEVKRLKAELKVAKVA